LTGKQLIMRQLKRSRDIMSQ